jgi:hypothetical protein
MPASSRPRRFRDRAPSLLLWCLVASFVLHFAVVPLLAGLFAVHPVAPQFQRPIRITISSALRIEHRIRTRPPQAAVRPRVPPPRRQAAHAVQPPRELAKRSPHARRPLPRRSLPPQRTAVLSAETLARQERQFEETIADAREAENPVTSAARAEPSPQTMKAYRLNVAGELGIEHVAQGILEPVRSWREGPYDYYYVSYSVQYPDGSLEHGIVPWPIRYLRINDPFTHGIHHLPLPVPMLDYQLPPGTALHPLVAFCYAHRYSFASCPIEHG